jgi:hypothetical protein
VPADPSGPEGEAAVLLGQVATPQAAEVLAARLVAEGVGAQAEGPRVWVRSADREEARALALLFHEVDQGRSRVASLPGAWVRTPAGRALRVVLAVALSLFVLVVVGVAVSL